jgi:hypothetical protein
VVLVGFIGFGIYSKVTHKGAKAYRLDCHNEVVVFENVYDKDIFKEVQSLILSGNYELKSEIRLSKYMATQMSKYVNMQDVDKLVDNQIKSYIKDKKSDDKKVLIDYYVYENDKEDPGKKTPKSKLYAGYLHFNYKLDDKSIYRFQIDFMDLQGKDISSRVDCAVKSLVTLNIN